MSLWRMFILPMVSDPHPDVWPLQTITRKKKNIIASTVKPVNKRPGLSLKTHNFDGPQ